MPAANFCTNVCVTTASLDGEARLLVTHIPVLGAHSDGPGEDAQQHKTETSQTWFR